jgi:hypothetical protein
LRPDYRDLTTFCVHASHLPSGSESDLDYLKKGHLFLSSIGRIFNSIFRLFSSVRFALWVILLLAIVSLAGTLLRQIPAQLLADPALKQAWVEQVAKPHYGSFWTPVFDRIGFFDVFHSPAFIVLGSLLIIAITVCSLKRMPSLIKTSKGVDMESAARLLDKGAASRAASKLPATENVATVSSFFPAADTASGSRKSWVQRFSSRTRTVLPPGAPTPSTSA